MGWGAAGVVVGKLHTISHPSCSTMSPTSYWEPFQAPRHRTSPPGNWVVAPASSMYARLPVVLSPYSFRVPAAAGVSLATLGTWTLAN